jgi:hypothetical protein
MFKLLIAGVILSTVSTSALCSNVKTTSLSDRAHQAYLKVEKIQSSQSKAVCIDNLSGGGFEFANAYLLEGDNIHAKESLYYEIEELKIASSKNCNHMDVINWGLQEAMSIINLIPKK